MAIGYSCSRTNWKNIKWIIAWYRAVSNAVSHICQNLDVRILVSQYLVGLNDMNGDCCCEPVIIFSTYRREVYFWV